MPTIINKAIFINEAIRLLIVSLLLNLIKLNKKLHPNKNPPIKLKGKNPSLTFTKRL